MAKEKKNEGTKKTKNDKGKKQKTKLKK